MKAAVLLKREGNWLEITEGDLKKEHGQKYISKDNASNPKKLDKRNK